MLYKEICCIRLLRKIAIDIVPRCSTMSHMKLESVIQVRIDEDVRAELQHLADAESRSLSQYIRLVLLRHIQDLHQADREQKAGNRKVKP